MRKIATFFFILFGIFLIFDGLISIWIQLEEPLFMHLGRIPRIIGGITLLYIGFKTREICF
jgi:hypothetical protein